MQCFHRSLRSILVDEAQQHADRNDGRDDDRIGRITREPGDRRATQEQQKEGVAKLAQQHPDRRHAVLSQHVGAPGFEPPCRLRLGETCIGRSHGLEHHSPREAR